MRGPGLGGLLLGLAGLLGVSAAPAWREDRLLVRPREDVAQALWAEGVGRMGLRIHRQFAGLGGVAVVALPPHLRAADVLPRLQATRWFEFVEPDYLLRPALTLPNDPRVLDGSQWALHNTMGDADLDAPEGWDIQNSASNIIVAIVDSGIRLTHEDLAANLWINPREIPGNGRDDDGNGIVDDLHGLNAIGSPNSTNLWDDLGHGTHIAGIIGAVGNNGLGGAGVAWRVQLMICKFMDGSGNGYISDAVECFDYARLNGARIINASFGTTEYSSALDTAISACRSAGIIVVAASGNDGANNDATPFYPASLGVLRNRDNVVAVAATDRYDNLASFSNYGSNTVHLAAPGQSIFSTYHLADNSYVFLSGTSMAAPHVAGVLALLRARYPIEHHTQIIRRMLDAVDRPPALAGKCRSGGRVNLWRALANYQILSTNYAWISLTNAQTLPLSNDTVSAALPLPFVFNWYGRNFTELYVGANGLLGFSPAGLHLATNTDLSSAADPVYVLCPYWDDLNPASAGSVTWGIRGEAPHRQVVVSWNGVPRASSSSTRLTFQAVLDEATQTALFQYQEVQPNRILTGGGGRSATVGIRGNGTPEEAARYTVNGTPFTLANQTALLFVPLATPAAELTPATHLVAGGPAGGPLAPQAAHYELVNLGNTPLPWWTDKNADWLEISPTNGVLQVGQRLPITLSLAAAAQTLPAGQHTALARVFLAGQSSPLAARTVSLTILGTNAALTVSPELPYTASGYEGGPYAPATFVYTLINTGDAATVWLAQTDAPWLDLSLTNGQLPAAASDILTLTLNAAATQLPPGLHTGQVNLINLSAGSAALTRAIVLDVAARPGLLVVTPDSGLSGEGLTGGALNPAQGFYLLSNTGPHALAWQATLSVPWAEIEPGQGTLAAGETAQVAVRWTTNAAALEPGDYQGTLALANLTSGAGNTLRPLSLRISPQPGRLVIASAGESPLCLTHTRGEPPPQAPLSLVLSNAGGTALVWSAEEAEPWLATEPADGQLASGQSVELQLSLLAEVNHLAPGTYTNEVRLLSLNGSSQTNLVPVTLELLPAPGRLAVLTATNSHQFHRFSGGPAWPPALTLWLTNHGDLSLEFSLEAGENWLLAQPAAGSLGPQGMTGVELQLFPHNLPAAGETATNWVDVLQATQLIARLPVELKTWPWPQVDWTQAEEVLRIYVPALPDKPVILEVSSDFREWTPVITNTSPALESLFWDIRPAEHQQYFRLRLP
ncbi:MAG: S8 family serine peptidase [Verrucomicrobiae bacterium]|nr:S8 family serine peptidase [Verrucomicrobiae bacterium]